MRIPIIDSLVDRVLRSKPEKVNFFFEHLLRIRKGEKSATIDIPCSLYISDFQLTFPSGIAYIFGDEEEKEESKETKFKICPAISVSLPDIADKDIDIPLQIGFKSNPRKTVLWHLFYGIFFCSVATYFAINAICYMQPITIFIGAMIFASFLAIVGATQLRVFHKTYGFWKNIDLKKLEKEVI